MRADGEHDGRSDAVVITHCRDAPLRLLEDPNNIDLMSGSDGKATGVDAAQRRDALYIQVFWRRHGQADLYNVYALNTGCPDARYKANLWTSDDEGATWSHGPVGCGMLQDQQVISRRPPLRKQAASPRAAIRAWSTTA